MILTLATKLTAGIALAAALAVSAPAPRSFPQPELVELPAGTVAFRPAGEFLRAGLPVDPPLATIRIPRRLAIMKRQVSAGDYRSCVDAGGCDPAAGSDAAPADHPAVNASWRDARAYAAWLSAKTGRRWRLPTEAEWAYAAGSRFPDDSLGTDAGTDRAQRAIARYEQETRRAPGDGRTRPAGAFGANEHGLLDLAGNVWEWTDTCFARVTLDLAGRPAATTRNCGIRVLEGPHRAYVADFIRDARSGGCAAGIPPLNLGFRLVRDDGPPAR